MDGQDGTLKVEARVQIPLGLLGFPGAQPVPCPLRALTFRVWRGVSIVAAG
jgi:hypothetical protein